MFSSLKPNEFLTRVAFFFQFGMRFFFGSNVISPTSKNPKDKKFEELQRWKNC
jgi:hypothetical protein